MIGRKIQGAEIVEIVLHFRALRDAEPGLPEQRFHAQAGFRHRMQPARRLTSARQRYVEPPGGECASTRARSSWARRAWMAVTCSLLR